MDELDGVLACKLVVAGGSLIPANLARNCWPITLTWSIIGRAVPPAPARPR
ncbi:MAG: hypothetical protein R2851_28475 [Caldilineaceae bacterium]